MDFRSAWRRPVIQTPTSPSASLFFGVSATDVATLSVTCLVLVGAAIFGSAWPTRVALRVEPIEALRQE